MVYWISHGWSHDDPNFTQPDTLYDGSRYHPGANREIRSVNANAFDAGEQCTYDSCGNLITGGFGAGTADRQHGVLSNLFDHRAHDVKPFELAYELDGNAHGANVMKYIEVRPTNPGKDATGNPCPTNKVPRS